MKRIRDPQKKKIYQHRWYVKHKSIHRKKMKQQRAELVEWYEALKTQYSCECGENHPATLDFHHLDSTKKDMNLSSAVCKYGWSKTRILEEIEKCKAICSNCHRKLHWKLRKDLRVQNFESEVQPLKL